MKNQAYRGTGKTINERAQTKICERKRKRNSERKQRKRLTRELGKKEKEIAVAERNTKERKDFMRGKERAGDNLRKKYWIEEGVYEKQ